MCGIAGIVNLKEKGIDAEALKLANDMLSKRGPDDAGVWSDNNAGLGHRRLSVIDLTSAAHQPMVSRDERYVIVYNGEVYNFQELRRQIGLDAGSWRSNSDTEVVLMSYHKWGADCLSRFHGMFALVIWDRQNKTLFAGRDRVGVKPFYYHYSDGRFIFASRPRAIFKIGPDLSMDIDEQALRFYLETGFIPAPYSIHKEIRKLEPAHYMIIDKNGLRKERYWDFRGIEPEHSWLRRKEDDLLDELDAVIGNSVRMRLISDVPLGILLSGGIDSSLVAALVKKHSQAAAVKTFNNGFSEKDVDESRYAREVAGYLGVRHHCECLRPDDMLGLIPNFIEEYDEPFFDNSAFPTMALSRMTGKYVKVALSGDGGDELFGGYGQYKIMRKLAVAFRMPRAFRDSISFFSGLMPVYRLKGLSMALKEQWPTGVFSFLRRINKTCGDILDKEVLGRTAGFADLFLAQAAYFPKALHASEVAMRLDALYTLPDDYLQKMDVASMSFSMESREPLLDHSLVEWAMRLPISWKLRYGKNKYLLRKLAYRYIPQKLLNRPKHGFGVPINKWLRGPLRGWAEEALNDKALFSGVPLNQDNILKLWNLHRKGADFSSSLLWAILVFLNFKKKYFNVSSADR